MTAPDPRMAARPTQAKENTMSTVEEFADDIRATPVRGGNEVDLSGPLAQHLTNLGYAKPFPLSPGLYRNKLGVEVEVVALRLDRNILGPVWDADSKDTFGVRHLVVTPEGMRDAGYERVGGAE